MDLKAEADVNCQRILEKIRESEDQVLSGLDALYETLPTQVFKTMRKALPGNRKPSFIVKFCLVTNSKMDWNLHVHKMLGTLKHR